MSKTMGNSTYFIWRYLVLQPIYLILVMVIIFYTPFVDDFLENVEIFFLRFGLILVSSLTVFILESILKKQANRRILRNPKEAGNIILTQLLRALVLAGSLVAILSFAISGNSSPISLVHGQLNINLYYILIYFIIYLVSTIVINILTTI